MRRSIFHASLVSLLPLLAPQAQEASFTGLGTLPGSSVSSARATTPVGAFVVGGSTSAEGSEAYRWTAETGMIGLGHLPGGTFSSGARSVSASGSVVVGGSSGANGNEAFRWTAETGMVGLGDLPGGAFDSEANDVSADGSVVVGRGRVPADPSVPNGAFVWTEAAGMVALPDLPGGDESSEATAITADGQVVVGQGESAKGFRAVRWVGGVPEDLGQANFVNDVSADGRTVVGRDSGGAFVWREGVGMEAIPPPGAPSYMEALGVSDGVVVVVGVYGSQGFWWTEAGGTRLLQDVLEDEYGLDLGGWLVTDPEEVRTDGEVYVVVGRGVNPSGQTEGWRAVLLVHPVAAEPEAPPISVSLSVAPNPSRGRATVVFTLPAPSPVRLAVYGALGREVVVLAEGYRETGRHEAVLKSDALPSGMYLVRFEADGHMATRLLTLLR